LATHRPIVGITPDVQTIASPTGHRDRAVCTLTYADAVARAGGVPILLAPSLETLADQLALCHAVVLTGGDDPRTEPYGQPTHPKATPLHPRRQAFETRLLELLAARPRPTLGVCLGMQLMALHAGGRLDQHMPDSRRDADRHWGAEHGVVPVGPTEPSAGAGRSSVVLQSLISPGTVHSKHRQAVDDPGRLSILARSDDGVIEAIADPAHRFYLGVQWHPERTSDENLGLNLFRALIAATQPRA